MFYVLSLNYRNDPKFSDGQVLANSADRPRSDWSTQFAILSASFGRMTL